MISTVAGISAAGPTPEKTLLTPNLDAELVMNGCITSMQIKPNTPTGCPTPASITRAMMELTGITPVFINAGLKNPLTVPHIDAIGQAANDPRFGDAVPSAKHLVSHGKTIGRMLSQASDLLVLGECVPGGTTTALCVLRALGYPATVSSSYANNPVIQKEAICREALKGILSEKVTDPEEIIRRVGDPMIAVAAGIGLGYTGTLVLAGGTQMLAVCAVIKGMHGSVPAVATTVFVRDDSSANIQELAAKMGVSMYYIDPGFGKIGHEGLARYCDGEVKEGTGAGGAMFLATVMGFSPEQIQKKIFETVSGYS